MGVLFFFFLLFKLITQTVFSWSCVTWPRKSSSSSLESLLSVVHFIFVIPCWLFLNRNRQYCFLCLTNLASPSHVFLFFLCTIFFLATIIGEHECLLMLLKKAPEIIFKSEDDRKSIHYVFERVVFYDILNLMTFKNVLHLVTGDRSCYV